LYLNQQYFTKHHRLIYTESWHQKIKVPLAKRDL